MYVIRFLYICNLCIIYYNIFVFRIKNSCPIKYTKQNIFDCWFHKNKSWSDLLSAQNQIKYYRFKNRSIIYNKQMLK